MASIIDRYSCAVHSTNLMQSPEITGSDVDVIGSFGFASKHEQLGVALARMLSGGGVSSVVDTMAHAVYVRSNNIKGCRLSRVQARDLAKAVLAWYRHGTCQPCGGTGYARIKNTPVNGAECTHCNGTGKILFDRQFAANILPLAQWLSAEIERSQAAAGYAAMVALAPKLDL